MYKMKCRTSGYQRPQYNRRQMLTASGVGLFQLTGGGVLQDRGPERRGLVASQSSETVESLSQNGARILCRADATSGASEPQSQV